MRNLIDWQKVAIYTAISVFIFFFWGVTLGVIPLGDALVNLAVGIVFIAFNVGMGKYQAYRFDVEQKTINHRLWISFYCLACLATFIITKNFLTVASCAAMHLPVFTSVLNLCRSPKRKIFYINPADPKGSWFDRTFRKWYKGIFFSSIIIFLILQILIYG